MTRVIKLAFVCIIICSLAGCVSPPSQTTSENEPFSDMWRSGDRRFTDSDQRAVAAAKSYLEKQQGGRLDARYKVKRTEEGISVFVMFVGGYGEDRRPVYYPGGHGTVYLRSDYTFSEYIPGA